MNDQSSIQLALGVTWKFLTVAGGLTFVIAFAMRWWQTRKVSFGHFVVGSVSVLSCFFLLIVYALATPFAWFFVPFTLIGVGNWLLYNNWYYWNFPHMGAWLASTEHAPAPPGMRSFLGKLLLSRDIPRLSWSASEFGSAGFVSIIVFLLSFGFVERINGIAEGDVRVRQSIVRSDQIAAETKKQVIIAAKKVADTLTITNRKAYVIDSLFRIHALQNQVRGLQNQAEILRIQGVRARPKQPQLKPVRVNVQPIKPRRSLRGLPGQLPALTDTVSTRKKSWFDRIFSGPVGRVDSSRLQTAVRQE